MDPAGEIPGVLEGEGDGNRPAESDGEGRSEAEGACGNAEPPEADALNRFLVEHRLAVNERPEIRANVLRDQRRALAVTRTELSRQIRNETRKRKRMVERSSKLSTQDLVSVLELRHERKVAAKAKAKAKAAA